jgi:hypothetical protein
MALNWIRDVTVHLRDGHTVRDAQGQEIHIVQYGVAAFEGGFAHIVVPGLVEVQVVPASAVWRASYVVQPRRLVPRRRQVQDPSVHR